VWALGVTLYCLVFARCPFLADGEFELFNVIAKQELFIPKRRLRPGQGYSASIKSLSRPTSSNRPLSLHHQRTHSGMSAKTPPIYPRPASGSRGKGPSEDYETEIIPDDLRDLLEKLLTKDPTERITIKEVKRHRWVLQGIANPMAWLENTDAERVNGGGRIEVNEEEMEKAVVSASWTTGMIKQVKSGINKLRQKMGMGGSASEGTTPKKEKVGLHPLASLGNNPRGPHSFLSANRPGSRSSNSTLQEQGEALNRFSLSLQTGTPYIIPKVVAPLPIPASSLTQLLAASPAKSIASTISNSTTKDMKPTSSPSRVHSPGTVKRFFDSQASLANSLSRSLSRSSHYSDRTAVSGAESTSPSTIKEKKDKILSPSFLRRTRSALTNGGSNVNDNSASEGAGGRGNKAVRRATSSNLGHGFANSPSPSSQSTIRRIPSPLTQESPSKDQVPKIRLATVPSHESTSQPQIQFVQSQEHRKSGGGGSVSGSATTRSRRSSASSNSTSMIQAHDTVAAALGGLFGKGKRLVRSFSRSRDTLASESEAVLSTSGGSGDDEGNHRGGLRISMLRRKRSSGVEASPVVSRVNAMGTVRSGTSTTAASPIYESGDGYFDIELLTSADVMPPLTTAATTSTITTSRATTTAYTTTTAATSTSASSTALHDFGSGDPVIEAERMQWSKGLNLHDTSCPPSPDDYIMWERQAKARERREAARKEQGEMARKLAESLQRIGNDGIDTSAVPPIPPQHLWQSVRHPGVKPLKYSSHNQQPQQPQNFAPEVNGRLVTSSSEERLNPKRGHRHTDTATSSLTESNSFPSIQSMMDSSAASSVSVDAGWPAAAKKITRPVTVPASVNRDSGVYSLNNGNGSIAVLVEDDMATAAPQQQHRISTASTIAHLAPPHASLSTSNTAYHSYIHGKSDEDDDGDDEALFLDLGTSNRRKSQALGESPRRPKSIAVGVLQHQHHKRAVSSTSARSKASETDREKGTSMDGTKERARRRRSRSNTASSAIGGGGAGSASEGRRDRDKRGERKEVRNKEKAQRERERAALPALPVPVTQ